MLHCYMGNANWVLTIVSLMHGHFDSRVVSNVYVDLESEREP